MSGQEHSFWIGGVTHIYTKRWSMQMRKERNFPFGVEPLGGY